MSAVRGRVQVPVPGGEPRVDGFDAVEALDLALRSLGHRARSLGDRLLLPESGLVLDPELLPNAVVPGEAGLRTVSVLHVGHPALFPAPVFEYQHAAGPDVQGALYAGFRQWAQLDLVAILDALRDECATCSALVLDLPATAERPARRRRVVLGPVLRIGEAAGAGSEGHDPGCPCCLLTHTFDAFRGALEDAGPRAIRLYAMRDPAGGVGADCRIDGVDHPAGMEALRAYAATWPGEGFDARKQYLVVHDLPAA